MHQILARKLRPALRQGNPSSRDRGHKIIDDDALLRLGVVAAMVGLIGLTLHIARAITKEPQTPPIAPPLPPPTQP